MSELTEGEKKFLEVYGGVVPLPPRDMRDGYVAHVIDYVFGEVWTKGNLSIRDRRLMILGIAAATGETTILDIQLRAALARGELSHDDLREILLLLSLYLGLPRTNALQGVIYKLLAEAAP